MFDTIVRIIVLILTYFEVVKSFSSTDFTYSSILSDDLYWLYWNILNSTHIEFGLQVKTLGWIGFGISPNGQMAGSDISISWVENGNVHLEDRYAIEEGTPIYDETQSLTLVEGYENNGYTYIRFIRNIYACANNTQDRSIETGTTRVIFSYNDEDPTGSGKSISIVKHQFKNSKSINLLDNNNNDTNSYIFPNDVMTYDLIMNHTHVPSTQTTYWCKILQLPQYNNLHQIIQFGPIIDQSSVVHHMLLYNCPSNQVDISNIGLEMDCDQLSASNYSESSCVYTDVFIAWAIGGGNYTFPDNVGLPLNTYQYAILSIHYNNELHSNNVYDSSGIRIWYTSTVREYNSSLIEMGAEVYPTHFIPAGITKAINYGYCTSECTSVGLDSKVYIIGSMLHAHTAGIALRARHVKQNGTEVANIDTNWNYDFNYQQITTIDNIEFEPGDSIILECYYNTSTRTNITYYGKATSNEMCLVYLYVYPEPNLHSCQTIFLNDNLTTWGVQAASLGYLTVNPYYKYYTNTQSAIDYYQSLWTDYPLRYQVCNNAKGNNLLSNPYVDYTEILKEYVDNTDTFCSLGDNGDNSKATKFICSIVYIIIIVISCLTF